MALPHAENHLPERENSVSAYVGSVRVRFKDPTMRSWRLGKLVAYLTGPSCNVANVIAIHSGNLHTLAAEHVEVSARGPRGGAIWVPLENYLQTEEAESE